jgi:hypothetical protein
MGRLQKEDKPEDLPGQYEKSVLRGKSNGTTRWYFRLIFREII